MSYPFKTSFEIQSEKGYGSYRINITAKYYISGKIIQQLGSGDYRYYTSLVYINNGISDPRKTFDFVFSDKQKILESDQISNSISEIYGMILNGIPDNTMGGQVFKFSNLKFTREELVNKALELEKMVIDNIDNKEYSSKPSTDDKKIITNKSNVYTISFSGESLLPSTYTPLLWLESIRRRHSKYAEFITSDEVVFCSVYYSFTFRNKHDNFRLGEYVTISTSQKPSQSIEGYDNECDLHAFVILRESMHKDELKNMVCDTNDSSNLVIRDNTFNMSKSTSYLTKWKEYYTMPYITNILMCKRELLHQNVLIPSDYKDIYKNFFQKRFTQYDPPAFNDLIKKTFPSYSKDMTKNNVFVPPVFCTWDLVENDFNSRNLQEMSELYNSVVFTETWNVLYNTVSPQGKRLDDIRAHLYKLVPHLSEYFTRELKMTDDGKKVLPKVLPHLLDSNANAVQHFYIDNHYKFTDPDDVYECKMFTTWAVTDIMMKFVQNSSINDFINYLTYFNGLHDGYIFEDKKNRDTSISTLKSDFEIHSRSLSSILIQETVNSISLVNIIYGIYYSLYNGDLSSHSKHIREYTYKQHFANVHSIISSVGSFTVENPVFDAYIVFKDSSCIPVSFNSLNDLFSKYYKSFYETNNSGQIVKRKCIIFTYKGTMTAIHKQRINIVEYLYLCMDIILSKLYSDKNNRSFNVMLTSFGGLSSDLVNKNISDILSKIKDDKSKFHSLLSTEISEYTQVNSYIDISRSLVSELLGNIVNWFYEDKYNIKPIDNLKNVGEGMIFKKTVVYGEIQQSLREKFGVAPPNTNFKGIALPDSGNYMNILLHKAHLQESKIAPVVPTGNLFIDGVDFETKDDYEDVVVIEKQTLVEEFTVTKSRNINFHIPLTVKKELATDEGMGKFHSDLVTNFLGYDIDIKSDIKLIGSYGVQEGGSFSYKPLTDKTFYEIKDVI